MRVSKARFKELVVEALDELPEVFRNRLENVEVVVEEVPPPDIREEFGGSLLGLYQGVPLTERSLMFPSPPDVISIYKGNIERICSSEDEIREEVRLTVVHEIGHYFGLDEEALEDV